MTLRIALISEHASPLVPLGGIDSGGQNVYVDQVARHLAARGHEVDVLTRCDTPAAPAERPLGPRARVVYLPAGPARPVAKEALLPLMPEFVDHAVRLARTRRYDLVHANFWMSGLAAAEIKRKLGIPYVITFHALGKVRRAHLGEADAFPEERLEIENWLVQQADRVIAECPQDEADLQTYYDASPERLRMIPCGFDPAELNPVDRRIARVMLGLPQDEPIVLQLGRMVPRKGVDTVIEAIGRLHREYQLPARLVVVGGDPECGSPS